MLLLLGLILRGRLLQPKITPGRVGMQMQLMCLLRPHHNAVVLGLDIEVEQNMRLQAGLEESIVDVNRWNICNTPKLLERKHFFFGQ